jgi:hypothetical protein
VGWTRKKPLLAKPRKYSKNKIEELAKLKNWTSQKWPLVAKTRKHRKTDAAAAIAEAACENEAAAEVAETRKCMQKHRKTDAAAAIAEAACENEAAAGREQ